MGVRDYSTTAASNTSISGINIAENCPPAGINDALRQMMADAAAAYLGWVNVKEYGAVGDDATDCTTAIRNAIAAADSGTLYFPRGSYKVTGPLLAQGLASIKIVGDGGLRYTSIRYTGSGTCLTVDESLNNFEISHINFDNDGSGAIGLQVNCTKFLVSRCSDYSHKSWSHSWFSAKLPSNYTYYGKIVDCYGDNSFANTISMASSFIELSGGHTITVDNCMANGYNRGLNTVPNGINRLLGLTINNCRFEAGSVDGGAAAVGIYLDGVSGLKISGGSIEMGRDQNVAAAAHRAIKMVDCDGGVIQGVGIQGGGVITAGIEIADVKVKDVVIEGNAFQRINGYAVIQSGTGKLSSCDIGVNSIDVVDGLYIDTLLPVLSFGGASTGITYFARNGSWQRSGNYLEFSMRIQLTSKGSATGNMLISGLPASAVSTGIYSGDAAFAASALSMNIAGSGVSCRIIAGDSTFAIRRDDTGAILTDADFTNGSDIIISGQYLIAAG